MNLLDFTVEVRDVDLVRVGAINHTDLILEATPVFNGVGSWRITLPKNHTMAAALSQPGSGIVITYAGQEIFSGPTNSPELTEGETPVGMQSFTGVSDDIALQDMLAWPVPSSVDMAVQGAATADTLTGPAETLMHQYINRNIGPAGHATRQRNVVLGPNEGRGASVTKNPRFTPLIELLNELALPDGLGFRLIQRGSTLRFETYMVNDLTDTIILSVENGGIQTQTVTIAAPTVTRTIVAGQGWATSRKYVERTNAKATAAEESWGRRIEKFVENSSTNITADLERSGDEALQDGGQTMTTTNVTPTEWASDRFMVDWDLGDVIGVVINGQQVGVSVKGAIIKADSGGLRLGMALSDVSSTARTIAIASNNPQAKVIAAVETLQQQTQKVIYNQSIDNQTGAAEVEVAQTVADSAQADATAALASADGKNTNYYSATAPSGGTYKVNDLWFDTDDGNKVYRWDGAAWAGTTFGNSAVANLDAGAISTGTLNADRISAQSITVEKLTIGTSGNVLANPGFDELVGGVYYEPHYIPPGHTFNSVTSLVRSGTRAGRIDFTFVGSTNFVLYSQGDPDVAENHPRSRVGDSWHGGMWVNMNDAVVTGAYVVVQVYDAAGNYVEGTAGTAAPGTASGWQYISATHTIASASGNHVVVALAATGPDATAAQIWVDDMVLQRRVPSEVIADTITGKTINGTTINGSNINGTTITGGIFQTATSGARWVIDTISSAVNRITGYSGVAGETIQSWLEIGGTTSPYVELACGSTTSNHRAKVTLTDSGAGTANIIAGRTTIASATPLTDRLDLTIDSTNGYFKMDLEDMSDAGEGLIVTTNGGLGANVGRPYRGFDGGEGAFTTNASSIITIPHDLGVVPAVVNINPISQRFLRRTAKSATNISVEVRDASTFALVGSGVSVQLDWVVFA